MTTTLLILITATVAGWTAAAAILWRARVTVRGLRAAARLVDVDLAAARTTLRIDAAVIADYRTRLAEILSTYGRYTIAEVADRPMGRLISLTGDSFVHATHAIRTQHDRIAYLESLQKQWTDLIERPTP